MLNINSIKIGFIGYGNMAQAMVQGFLLKGTLKPEQIFVCANHWEKLYKNAQRDGLHACENAEETAKQADVVVVAVKPHMVQEVTAPIREILQKKIVVSVAAGMPFGKYEELLLPDTHHISTIPNTPVSVGEGIIVCEKKHSLTEEEFQFVKELFSAISLVQHVETAQLSIAGTISGCGPAFVSMFIEALADAGVMHGLSRTMAYDLAGQMVAGTGKLQAAAKTHPGVMKDAVCSPGGTTIVGVAALERGGMRAAVIDAVSAIQKK